MQGTVTRCFLEEETQVLECLTGAPASHSCMELGFSLQRGRWVPGCGAQGGLSAPFTLGTPVPEQPVEGTMWLWAWPVGCRQHVLSFFGPTWAWLGAPCPSLFS